MAAGSESLCEPGLTVLKNRGKGACVPSAESSEDWSSETQVKPQSTALVVRPFLPQGRHEFTQGNCLHPASPALGSPVS